ncbi:hypothetical protein ACPPVO_03365 [Dactylosporangium sp. McL0621]|uniref:hypothetical protein n=1 Tax=Dactylosporangium sp. McL0621 TaxID=3415678 RepID=UPI003CFB9E92
MMTVANDLVHLIWQHVPDLTVALRFGAALVAFALACGTAIRRWRRRRGAGGRRLKR